MPARPAADGVDLAALAAAVDADVRAVDARFGARQAYHVDPVPRVIEAATWDALAAGVAQRVRALQALLADLAGPCDAVRAGIVPEDVVASCLHRADALAGSPPPAVRIAVAGPDLVQDATGRFVVLEDNLRTPTMLGYALVARRALARHRPDELAAAAPRPLEDAVRGGLLRVLRAAAPEREDPVIAILGDGPGGSGAWGCELDVLAELLDVPLVGTQDLTPRGDAVLLPDGRRADVLWRRTSEERLHDDAGTPNELGRLLLGPLRAGALRVVNAFGTGVADDKRLLPHADALVRFFCGEEPLLATARTWHLTTPEGLREAEARAADIVLKPRFGSGGHGVCIGPQAAPERLAAVLAAVRADPGDWIAQEVVDIATEPCVVDGRLEERCVDLRPYALCDGERVEVLPAALTRVAPAPGDLVVNASQGGGGKDTWVR